MENKNYPPTFFLSLFPTKEKKNANSPDFKISAKVGTEFVDAGAGWRKQGAKGIYLSLSVDIEVAKKLIMEKIEAMPSSGQPIPFEEPAKDPFDGM